MKNQPEFKLFRHLSILALMFTSIPLALIGSQTKAVGHFHTIHDPVTSLSQVRDVPHPECNYTENYNYDCMATLQGLIENNGFGHVVVDSDHFFRPSLPVTQVYYDSLMDAGFETYNSFRLGLFGLNPINRSEFNFLYARAQVRNFPDHPSLSMACSSTVKDRVSRARFIVCFNINLDTLTSDLFDSHFDLLILR